MVWSLPLEHAGHPDNTLNAGQDGTLIRRSVLPGGVRVITEQMPGQRSVTVGAWFNVGSRDEADGHYGSTHFLEHLLFKGTPRRTAFDIAGAFDSVGGEANAVTGKENTCYYARVLDTDLPMAVDVILDMVTSASLDAHELEIERGVILEELAMNDDDPGDVIHEHFTSHVLGDHPLGRPIGGTAHTITAVPREAVWAHYRAHYVPEGLVVTAAGSVDHDVLCDMVLEALDRGGWDLASAATPLPRRSASPLDVPLSEHRVDIPRATEQAHVIVGCQGLSAADERRFDMSVLTAALGGGMSSRIFQEIREKRGLAYSTYCFGSSYSGIGTFGLYAGCAPARVRDVESLMVAELEKLAAHGLTHEEMVRTQGQLRGSLVLGVEDSGARMNRLGRAELVTGELYSLDESIHKINAVTAERVQSLAQELARRVRVTATIGLQE
ncbi:M16 family metallopeptidase [Jonesia denitrificans]|uniref:Processing peptidase n=1 Tax=Jonesia denitrificans (strain ATCC 14870 / DSM 20603 / BCRC 15368 / CIP 55.134 / JCM 11481 / NBRC 15587 / NCTC 10816 / Prevot 55134) TaxID=471856 RepID=C7R3E6_JONDD|nr:pitrilysin family protein [Jonesia denitrificans]ACV08682.1 processing peptidase [Jonesia denitrificans DSM 20603]ASE09984.1 insulinase family protein [Jonesia denitrificans]QXB42322.1 insulinase family protein [Jonesia denitrificans]SQH20671.1 Protease 3 precursor [Jonesia denitrificans]